MAQPQQHPDVAELAQLIQELAESTGRPTQERQAAALGVPDASLSYYRRGRRVPTHSTLVKMLQQADVPPGDQLRYLQVRERAASASGNLPPAPAGQPAEPAELAVSRAGRSWRTPIVIVLCCLALGTGIGVVLLVARDRPAAPATCDRYEVTAETLALRTATGAVTGSYLTRGQRVTVRRRGSDSSARYWYVVADDHREGWVLPAPEWWHPICQSA
jgi:transcriptional regulator with XRE-family HTH domain